MRYTYSASPSLCVWVSVSVFVFPATEFISVVPALLHYACSELPPAT